MNSTVDLQLLAQTPQALTNLSPITDIIAELRAGRMVVLVDEENRENEGDLLMAAEFVTPAAINFMATHGRGLICLTLTEARCQQLNLEPMVARNGTSFGTNFTASIEAARGVTTGISVADRACTVLAAVNKTARPEDIVSPGHVFPLMAQKGGVLARAGHTEAGCDLTKAAGLEPAAVICEILKDDGNMARLPDLLTFAGEHGLKIGTIADLISYRSETECLVQRAVERDIDTGHGKFRLVAYHDQTSQDVHLALVKGNPCPDRETLVRVHEPLSVVDLLDSDSKAHSWSIQRAMQVINEAGEGVIILLRRSEDGEALMERIRDVEHVVHSQHVLRDYGVGAQILRDLNVGKMSLLALPRKIPNMNGFGLEVTRFISPTD
jgi:3,4-dihydroxy 2-butanone 4-phosphate synthase/GTP cyclohydrolase II